MMEFDGEWLSVDSIGFYGRYTHSPDRSYLLAFGKARDERRRTRSSDDADGAVVLIRDGSIVSQVNGLRRPESGSVSNRGTFAVYDWGIAGSLMSHCLMVFADDGEPVLSLRPGAALDGIALSGGGNFLSYFSFAAPADSPTPRDGESIWLWSLDSRAVLWKRPVPVVWPSEITFDEVNQWVVAHAQGGECYRYTQSGEFLDADKAANAQIMERLEGGYGYPLLDRAIASLSQCADEDPSASLIASVVEDLNRALELKMSPNSRARALRVLGELAEESGEVAKAIDLFRKALVENPKVGVKVKLKRLLDGRAT